MHLLAGDVKREFTPDVSRLIVGLHIAVLVQLPPHRKHVVDIPDGQAAGHPRQQHHPRVSRFQT